MRKIFFLLLLIIPVITACNSEKNLAQNSEINISANNNLIADCIAAAEEKYLKDMEDMCENHKKTESQKIKTCEEIYFPWKQQGISRDQYCRNITVETVEPKENYRVCMESMTDDLAININRCTGSYAANTDNYCNLPDLFLQKIEEDKKNNISKCNELDS